MDLVSSRIENEGFVHTYRGGLGSVTMRRSIAMTVVLTLYGFDADTDAWCAESTC